MSQMIAPSSSVAPATTFRSTGENITEYNAPGLSAVCKDAETKSKQKKVQI